METIIITEGQRNELCSELARLTFEFRKDKNVECICFATYKSLITGNGIIMGNVLEFTLVREGGEKDLEEKLKEYNSSHQTHDFVRKSGFKIYFGTIDSREYAREDLKNNLINSKILYDKNGEFTEIQVNNEVNENYNNDAEVFPPLDEALSRAMDVARMERDTEAVKEFTKSRLFQHIINM